MRFKKAKKEDIKDIVEIEYKSGYKWVRNKKEIIKIAEQMFKSKLFEIYFLELNKKKIGYFGLRFGKSCCDIDYFVIMKKYHGKGLANLIMNKIISISKKKKYNKMELCVWAKNIQAVELYSKFGFIVYRTKKRYYKNGDDKFLMRKNLK